MPRNATTSIKRPPPRPASDDGGSSRLGDFTRPIPVEKRISRRPTYALIAILFALAVVGAAAAAVFVLPISTWREQDVDLVQRQAQLDELTRVNAELQREVDRLLTDDGVREAAREDYGYVEQGERRSSILPLPALTYELLPTGWPYNGVLRIVDATEAGLRPEPMDTVTPGVDDPAVAPPDATEKPPSGDSPASTGN